VPDQPRCATVFLKRNAPTGGSEEILITFQCNLIFSKVFVHFSPAYGMPLNAIYSGCAIPVDILTPLTVPCGIVTLTRAYKIFTTNLALDDHTFF
jgi:hypothetical protein